MRFFFASILLMVAMIVAGCDRASTPREQAPDHSAAPAPANGKKADFRMVSSSGLNATFSHAFAGTRAPDAPFTGADGRDVTLADYKGRPLLVNLWATWCAPCKAEMPTLDALAASQEGRLSVVVVSQDIQGRVPVQVFFNAAKITNVEPYTDPDNALMAAYSASGELPMTILYDSSGHEVWRVTGGVEWGDAEIAKLLAEAD